MQLQLYFVDAIGLLFATSSVIEASNYFYSLLQQILLWQLKLSQQVEHFRKLMFLTQIIHF